MTAVIRIIGRSGSGKTTLLEGVVRDLTASGLRVAVLKDAHHRVDLDRRGKDSYRFAEAGAVYVTVSSPEKVAAFEANASKPPLEDLVARIPVPVDVVLAEGFHDAATPYFLLLPRNTKTDDRPAEGELLGVISADEGDEHVLRRTDVGGIAAAIRAWFEGHAGSDELDRLLAEAQAFHGHLCPGQLLGVRLAVVGCQAVGVPQPRGTKKLIAWVETDRCGADAVQTVTGCKLGKRTLKFVDYGKLAASFLNTETGEAVRVVARADSRARATELWPELERHDAQMRAYRELPDDELFEVQRVILSLGEYDRPGKPMLREVCTCCGEEVNDGRHVEGDDGPVCRSCAGGAYYRLESAQAENRTEL